MKNIDLDKLNNGRIETSKQKIAEVIRLVGDQCVILKEDHVPADGVKKFSKAICMLEKAVEDLHYACSHFKWNDDVCDLVDGAVGKFGMVVAELIVTDDKIADDSIIGYNAIDGIILLSKALGVLALWFDDETDDPDK